MNLTEVRITGNPTDHNIRVALHYSNEMGVSVFVAGAPLRRNDYVSFYDVKEELTGDQYRARYPVGVTSLTDEYRRDKDYIIKYDNDLYLVGDHTEPLNPLGIAQYLNCAMRSSGPRNNCKLVKDIIDGKKCTLLRLQLGLSTSVNNYLHHMAEGSLYRSMLYQRHVLRRYYQRRLSVSRSMLYHRHAHR